MQINYAPALTQFVSSKRLLETQPFVLLDIGARGGQKKHWNALAPDLQFIGFEPHPEEFARLEKQPGIKILPYGLGEKDEVRVLHIHRNPSSSSIFREDPAFLSRLMLQEAFEITDTCPIELCRLDDIANEIGNVDFIELDTEGAELEILRGGETLLKDTNVLGVYTEIRFQEGFNTPLFGEVDAQLRKLGFSLYDLSFSRESRRTLPYRMSCDTRHDTSGEPIFGPTVGGQVMYGDAVYLRDYVGKDIRSNAFKVLKLACLYEIFGQNDSAAELLEYNQSLVDGLCDSRALIQKLVPACAGRKIPYREYLRRYFNHDSAFRRPSIYDASINLASALVQQKAIRKPIVGLARKFGLI